MDKEIADLIVALTQAVTMVSSSDDEWLPFTKPPSKIEDKTFPALYEIVTCFLKKTDSAINPTSVARLLSKAKFIRGEHSKGINFYRRGEEVFRFNPHDLSDKATPIYKRLVLVSREATLTSKLTAMLEQHKGALSSASVLSRLSKSDALVAAIVQRLAELDFSPCPKPESESKRKQSATPSSSSSSSSIPLQPTKQQRVVSVQSEKENAKVMAATESGKLVLEQPATADLMIRTGRYIEKQAPTLLPENPATLSPDRKAAQHVAFLGRTLATMKRHGEQAVAQYKKSSAPVSSSQAAADIENSDPNFETD